VIPLARHLNPHLATLLAQFGIDTRAHPNGGTLVCDVITVTDVDLARDALTAYHAERWNRPPGGAGPVDIRLSDLGELVGALSLHHHDVHVVESIYPLTFSSPGPTAQPAGIDVLGVSIHAGAGPLLVDERLSVAEAKSTLDDDATNAISGIQADVKKCTAERITDSLFVLKWEYERDGDPNHLRLHLFVTDHTSLVGSIVIDPLVCDVDKTVASIFNRLDGKSTPAGAPLARVLLLALPGASAFIEATL
jgi:hypothetical protein